MKRLTKKEEEIMQILWKLKKAFVKEILAEIPSPQPHYNTVSSLVRFLEDKGFIGHKAYGNTHQYFPLISKEDYRKQFFGKMVQDYFANSYKGVLSFLTQEEKISVEELKELIKQIEEQNPEK